ncbi:malonyl-ACP O-methyltransferase BioC [Luteimonas kalidii]|uniref:Malonyl-[acyl-carrier protein] O-methyltransferase n=1 Tax=Luteimonas kalidii TaxID=3042025 RepID=A0ABT6JRV5_9GAMM|nr:malonyl-ACP O-methyltransferase BioC [Luteimonas kalidii]MDH5833327.1 malonyl-ACP O-methyltransferase BioC [Luteimonas kalidii]
MSRTPQAMFDARQVRRSFSRASAGYASAAALQREVETRLLESLDLIALTPGRAPDWSPAVVLDVGSGPGHAAQAMRRRWPKTRVVALDLSHAMLQQLPARGGLRDVLARRPPVDRVCADLRALPLADASVDVVFSNLCLQWIDDLPAAFAGFRRVLRPGGLLLCSTFGPDTLWELREAFARADDTVPHVSPFASIAQFGDALMHAGFRDPVLDRDLLMRGHPDLPALMRELRAIGATNALHARRHTLTGRARFAAAAAAYEPLRGAGLADAQAGLLPASWEVISALAWAPAPGAPIRDAGGELASFPADRIRVRRRD